MSSRRVNIVLDWDVTLTKKDTMFAMGKIADSRDRRLGRATEASKAWKAFGEAYMHDFAAHQESYVPCPKLRTDRDLESAWLKSLSVVEAQSVARVETSGFLRGVSREDVRTAAHDTVASGEVSLRSGWRKLFSQARAGSTAKNAHKPGLAVSILSVNWSEAFIRAALKESANMSIATDEHDFDSNLDAMNIVTNEIRDLDRPEGSPGQFSDADHPSIRTSFDKFQNFRRLPQALNVYVGDSPTDFDCLLTADVGICMRDDPMGFSQHGLAETLQRVGYKTMHVSEIPRLQSVNCNGRTNSLLFWAKDFDEILSALSTLQNPASMS